MLEEQGRAARIGITRGEPHEGLVAPASTTSRSRRSARRASHREQRRALIVLARSAQSVGKQKLGSQEPHTCHAVRNLVVQRAHVHEQRNS